MKIIFYYNDGETIERELKYKQDKDAIEIGVLRGLYSIALQSPEFFKEHYMVGYELVEYDKETDRNIVIDAHCYVKSIIREEIKKNEKERRARKKS